MSAYVVTREHIDALVRLSIVPGPSHMRTSWYAVDPDSIEYPGVGHHDAWVAEMRTARREANHSTANAVGQMLAFENAASVLYRYPDHDNSEYVPAWTTDGSYTYRPGSRRPSNVEGLKLIDCYEYQSCEHPGWHDSEARRFCEALRSRLIRTLPGYEEAPWEWSVDTASRGQ